MKKRTIVQVVVIAAVVAGLLFSMRGKKPAELDSGVRMVMGTVARIVVVAPDEETARASVSAGFAELVEVDERMSDYKPDSELSRVNNEAFGREMAVSEELFAVLERSVEISGETDGAFDVTVGPLSAIFRRERETGMAATEEEIAAAREKVGYRKLILNRELRTVRFEVEGMKLDLGAIAKGYGIDKAAEAMRAAGAIGGMVDVGGDIRCFGKAAGGAGKWRLGVEDPQAAEGEGRYLFVLEFDEGAVATSGDYRRFVMIGGERESHIIDTSKGRGSKGLRSVTAVADNAMDADGYATAVTVMGTERGLAYIGSLAGADGLAGVEAVVIDEQGAILATAGAKELVRDVKAGVTVKYR